MVPSMMAWGLNQVTTQAVVTTLAQGTSTSAAVSSGPLSRSRPIPIQITIPLPTKRTAMRSHSKRCMMAPIPKKQAKASVTSKKMTMRAVR